MLRNLITADFELSQSLCFKYESIFWSFNMQNFFSDICFHLQKFKPYSTVACTGLIAFILYVKLLCIKVKPKARAFSQRYTAATFLWGK